MVETNVSSAARAALDTLPFHPYFPLHARTFCLILTLHPLLPLQTERKGYAAFWWFWLQDSFARLAGKALLMVLDVSQTYPDPKLAPTNVKNFGRVARKIDDCRRLSNNVRGRQMVEFKRRYAGGNSIAVELLTLGVGCHFR